MNDINKLALGKRIKNIRVTRKDTLETFAQAIQVETNHTLKTTKSNVSKWEKGSNIPNDITLKAIADLGNTTVDYLIYGDPEERIHQILSRYDNVNSDFSQWVINGFLNRNESYPSEQEIIEEYNNLTEKIEELRNKNASEHLLALNLDQIKSILNSILISSLDSTNKQLITSAINEVEEAERNYEIIFNNSIEEIKEKYK